MKPIQLILSSLLLVVILILVRIRSRLLDRLVILFLAGCGIVMVAMPEWTTKIAHLLGVGRGADLISYFGVIGLGVISVLLYSKLREVESLLTELARAVALEHARIPTKPEARDVEVSSLRQTGDKAAAVEEVDCAGR